MSQPLTLWTNHPLVIDEHDPRPKAIERDWEREVYPIGNGCLGGTLFGEPRCERLQFNHDTMWVGNEHNTGAYQPFGDVYVKFPHDTYTAYRRELDLDRAVQTVTYEAGGVRFRRECFASRPAQVIVMRLSADQPGALTGAVSMGNIHEIPIAAEGQTLVMCGDTRKLWYWQFQCEDPTRLLSGREYASAENIVLDVEARVRVLHEGGSIKTEGDTVTFIACDSLTLLLAADTNYLADRTKGWRGEHPHAPVCQRITEAAKHSYDTLLAEHIADHQQFFGRVALDLGDTPIGLANLPTAQRVQRYGLQGAVQAEDAAPSDRQLEVLLYQYARYLLIGSSAPGERTLPANLQGIWCIAKRPPWRCDFHTDVNVQMNYWFSQVSNLADCFLPLAHWIDSIREVRKEETREVFGMERGWLMRSENGPFGGSTWHVQKGDSAWLCQNLWDQYAFTQDRAYLQRYAYPVMKEISEFWLDHLKELPDGTLVVPEGRSPEHGPVGVDGVTYDQCLCWDLFNNTIEAAEALGVDDEFAELLTEKRDRLLGPRIGRWGQLQEWMEDIDDPEDDHRHINHMIGVYPGRQIHATLNADYAKAAHVGLVARRDHGPEHPGWSRVWKACMFARLGDPPSAYRELVNVLGKKIFGNLWAVHPPFQIDANFGYAAGINEILVQSHLQTEERRYIVHLLPALPGAWATGSVRGLRVRGGYEVDIAWRDGKLTQATLRRLAGGKPSCAVQYGDATCAVELAEGEARVLRADRLACGGATA